MKTKVLFIGANSALAKDVKKELEKDCFEVITAGRHDCDLYIDINNSFDIPENIDTVINFAALFASKSDNDYRKIIDTNIKGAINTCIACKHVKHLIQISSLYTQLKTDNIYYSDYAITKKCADELAKYYCKLNNINLTILKPSQIYGNIPEFKKNQPLFYTILDNLSNGKDVDIYGTNNAKRNYINSLDLAEIIKRVIKQSVYGEFTCSYPENIKILDIVEAAKQVLKKSGNVNVIKNKPDIIDNIFEYDDSLYKIINYFPKIDLKKGIKMWNEYKRLK